MTLMASSAVCTLETRRPPSAVKNFSSTGVAPSRTTSLPALSASATSDTVPDPPRPQATITWLDSTQILFLALPISVMIATSTYFEILSLVVGRTPTVKLLGTFLAPWLAACMTPTFRPPVRSTHSRRAISSPSVRAFSTSLFLALAGPMTPTTYRTRLSSYRDDCSRFKAAFVKSMPPLETRRSERDVRMSPRLFEPARDLRRFGVFALSLQGLEQTKEAPSVFGIPFQIGSIFRFSLGSMTGEQQDGAEIVPDRQRPVRRLGSL